MDNGILQVTLSVPGGIVTAIRYNGIDNLLEVLNKESNRGYFFYICLISIFNFDQFFGSNLDHVFLIEVEERN